VSVARLLVGVIPHVRGLKNSKYSQRLKTDTMKKR
jgi:hypothetical protein